MASIIDELLEQRDHSDWVEHLAGIRYAQAGNLTWQRDPRESEADFLDRVRDEAAAAGHRTIAICGWLKV